MSLGILTLISLITAYYTNPNQTRLLRSKAEETGTNSATLDASGSAQTQTPTNTPTSNTISSDTRTYYVSPNGNDSNSGTTKDSPLKTIQVAVDKAQNPGDTVLVMPGTYKQVLDYTAGEVVRFENRHGAPGKDIVLKAYDPNNLPIIKGYSGIRFVASSYITVDGFEITDITNSAFPVYLSNNITIKNNYLHLDYEGQCSASETGSYAGCTYYSSLGIGHIKGRHDKNDNIIVEHDDHQNVGIYLCKTINSTFSNNRFENWDESIYAGKAGDVGVYDCWTTTYNLNRTWVEGNVFENNSILDSWNEAIELKSDTRLNTIRGNVIKSTRQFVETSQIEIRGHDNLVENNIIVGSPKDGIRVMSESVSDPDGDRIEAYKKTDGSYKSSYKNIIKNNYIYYWAQYSASSYAITANESSAANLVEHNTIVGNNNFSGVVSQYAGIKTYSSPEAVVKNNLMVGVKRYDVSPNQKYEYHLISNASYMPQVSDYNGYYPRLRTNNTSCTISLGNAGIVCENNNAHNQTVGYEYHSKFMDSNPLKTDEAQCSKAQLLSTPIGELKNKIFSCSTPTSGSQVISAATDGTNIGAFQSSSGQTVPTSTSAPIPTNTPTPTSTKTPTPTPTSTPTPTKTPTPTPTPTNTPTPTSTNTPTPTPTISTPLFKGEYFNNRYLSGSPKVTRFDNAINFYWGRNGSPNKSIKAYLFSARWTRKEYFAGGTYQFNLRHDDGLKIYIDNTLIYNNWGDQAAKTQYKNFTIPTGNHDVKVEYYEKYGVAEARVSWVKL